MTEIADLIDIPQVRLSFRMKAFVETLQQKHRREEEKLDVLLEQCRTRLHRLHLKTESVYKQIFDELLVKLNNDEDATILDWFEFVMKTERKDLVADILDRATPVVREIERAGGELEVDIRRAGYGSGGCMYRDRRGGYFSFCSEFLDGYDDDYVYVIRREQKSKVQAEKERDARLEAHFAEWRRKEREKLVTAEEAAAAVAAGFGGQLREEAPADA